MFFLFLKGRVLKTHLLKILLCVWHTSPNLEIHTQVPTADRYHLDDYIHTPPQNPFPVYRAVSLGSASGFLCWGHSHYQIKAQIWGSVLNNYFLSTNSQIKLCIWEKNECGVLKLQGSYKRVSAGAKCTEQSCYECMWANFTGFTIFPQVHFGHRAREEVYSVTWAQDILETTGSNKSEQ